ncbi:hypothetical protein ARAM_002217 [Aspergillus rambellii]|uniref:Glycosyltransferase 2-like domain-containing protein n=2 Tax=Aspergillus subgen. Nidulantes TaxID=2720870 RepID=A0A0F8WXY9_9EURO|nr:hypothetical protein ARAM_002217 [Aspergillus rambellii]
MFRVLVIILLLPFALTSPLITPFFSTAAAFTSLHFFRLLTIVRQYVLPFISRVNFRVFDLARACLPAGRFYLYAVSRFLRSTLAILVGKLFAKRDSTYVIYLFIFRHLCQLVHLISYWCSYRAIPVPKSPTLRPSDCTVILPTLDPTNPDFAECLGTCLVNAPSTIIVVTAGQECTKLTKEAVASFKLGFPRTKISVKTASEANKRLLIVHGLRYVRTKVTVLLDDRVFWPSTRFLPALLAPFEDPKVGAVEGNTQVRRTEKGFNMKSFWNMMEVLFLERDHLDTRATNAIDAGLSLLSGRTSAHRSEILTDPSFTSAFLNDRCFSDKLGPLNADDDTFITCWNVQHGWDIKIQHCHDALIETTLATDPNFRPQCARVLQNTWRRNLARLFANEKPWYRQSWCVFAIYLTSFVNLALLCNPGFIYSILTHPLGLHQTALSYLLKWIFFTKMVNLIPHYLREPQDLVMLPGYVAFAYVNSVVKIYAALTFWKINAAGTPGQPPSTNTNGNSTNDVGESLQTTGNAPRNDPSSWTAVKTSSKSTGINGSSDATTTANLIGTPIKSKVTRLSRSKAASGTSPSAANVITNEETNDAVPAPAPAPAPRRRAAKATTHADPEDTAPASGRRTRGRPTKKRFI